LAYMAKRNILLFYIVAAPSLGYALAHVINKIRSEKIQSYRMEFVAAAFIVFLGMFFVPISNQIKTIRLFYETHCLSPFRVPVGGEKYLRDHEIKGNGFNTVRYGGYLIWQQFPKRQVYIDGRLVIRTPDFFSEYLAVAHDPETFESIVKKYTINHAILPVAVFYQFMPLIKRLYNHPEWKLVFLDGESIIFVHNTLKAVSAIDVTAIQTLETIASDIQNRYEKRMIQYEAIQNCANLLHYLGIHKSAEYFKSFKM